MEQQGAYANKNIASQVTKCPSDMNKFPTTVTLIELTP